MTYGVSDGHVTNDVAWPIKVVRQYGRLH